MADQDFDEFRDFCYHIGLALVTWQDVEESHFKLFFKLMGAPNEEVASIAYHNNESFQSRHVMVGRMMDAFMRAVPQKPLYQEWQNETGGLNRDLKEANLNRNKLAHYAWENEVLSQQEHDDGSISIEFGPSKLQPSSYNAVSRLLGRTPDNPAHNLDVPAIREYIKEFRRLANVLDRFHVRLKGWPPEISLAREIGLRPRYLDKPRK